MKLRRVRIENVRSFLEPQELLIDGDISIVIGPNGGGKTNLLDIAITTIRQHLLTSWVSRHSPTAELPERYEFQANEMIRSVSLERHSRSQNRQQLIEIELEVTAQDVINIKEMQESASKLADFAEKKYIGAPIRQAARWNTDILNKGERVTYRVVDNSLQPPQGNAAFYKDYLSLYEADSRLRDELKMASLSTPMLSLPVNRAASGFQSSLSLANYNEYDYKRSVDAATSRSAGSISMLALGRFAERYRLLLEEDTGRAKKEFYEDPQIKSLSKILSSLGYEWSLESVEPRKNQYDIRLRKQGSSFLVGTASSGEKEVLTYLFAVYGLNVRDALIFVDEPEMHLHPKWQETLFNVFETLAKETRNQFILATHSPIFVSPASIQYVSRVFSQDQQSRIVRLNSEALPEPKHLFSIVNSQNNESVFFSDKVILVEGISDRLFFDAVLKRLGVNAGPSPVFEIVSVGGKGFFKPYKILLEASQVRYAIIADLDYVCDVGTQELKNLFAVDAKSIKEDVIDNQVSMDGQALVARLDQALESKNLEDLTALWNYIKGRRRRLRTHLTAAEETMLNEFIRSQRENSLFILAKGDLETYLPEGYRAKDMDKLIRFLNGNFWDDIPPFAQKELTEIGKRIAIL
jgi:putative ATP-dependent endonuclease of the OLD family